MLFFQSSKGQRRPRAVARLAALSLWLLAGAGFGSAAFAAQREEGRVATPNIVFILADDLGWADIGYHDSAIRTPNLDRLAREGVRFERHYVDPTCTPTRVGLISGRYPSRFGVLSPAYGRIFKDDTATLASALKRGGYDTYISGKWHMGSPPDYGPMRYGFTGSYGYFHGQIDPYTHRYKTGVRSWHRNDKFLDEKGHATDLITAEAVRIIEGERSRPFFLYVAYSVPHYPLNEPEKWTSMYKGKFPSASRTWYAASVSHMDDGIGRIVAALDRTGRRAGTLLVFSSDNGGQRSWHSAKQYHGRYADKPHDVLGDNRPWRGWKGEVYEGGIRVPAFANWPGVLAARTVSESVHVVDWMPTLCRLAGVAPGTGDALDGVDIWPLATGRRKKLPPRVLYWKTPGAAAVLEGDWKLVTDAKGREGKLYDLGNDPGETRDLAGEKPAKTAELLEQFRKLQVHDTTR